MKCKITVGMPVYNGAEFVAEALESWLAQDFGDFELVISDNASTDATPRILAEFAARDSRIRILRRATTVVSYENFNGLVKEAQTPLFTWAACDDLRHPPFLRRMHEVLESSPDAVAAYCLPGYFGDCEPRRRHHPLGDPPAGSVGTPLGRAVAVLRSSNWLPVYGVIRTDALRRTRLLFYPMSVSSDVGLGIELASLGRLVCVPEALMATRLHTKSVARDLSDPLHALSAPGRRVDAGVRAFVEGLPLTDVERRILMREVRIYCRKGEKPRRGLWRWSPLRKLGVHIGRRLVDAERILRRTG